MGLRIDFKHKDEKSDVAKLANIINETLILRDYVGEWYIEGESLKANKDITKETRKNELNDFISEEFEVNPLLKSFDNGKKDFFIKTWINLYNKDKLSELLEELVRINGPFNLSIEPLEYSREAKVYCTIKLNNFDVVFFRNDNHKPKDRGRVIEIKDIMEFHECKTNACNYIPADPKYKLNKGIKKKLDFMQEVYSYVDKKGYANKIFIPTFYENIDASQEYLNVNGYEYIEIVPYSSL